MHRCAILATLGVALSLGAPLEAQPQRIGPSTVRGGGPARGPARAPRPPATAGPDSPVGMAGAARCMREHSDEPAEAHECVIRALEGNTPGEPELGLLAQMYRFEGRRVEAVRTMRLYLERFPDGPRKQNFERWLARH